MALVQFQNPAGGRPMRDFIFSEDDSRMAYKMGYVQCHCGACVQVSAGLEIIQRLAKMAHETTKQRKLVINLGRWFETIGKKLVTNG